MIPGPDGELEVLFSVPSESKKQTIAIICHPHPLHGGTMQNKVVHTVDKALYKSGFMTLRFNFRGVGKSTGDYDHAVGEVDDLKAVINWAKEQKPEYDLCLAGFSFGAYVAMKTALDVDCTTLITIAPPVDILDFSSLQAPDCAWLLIQGMQDEIVDADKVVNWASQFSAVNIVREQESGHFFHGKLNVLQEIIIAYFQGDSLP